MFFFQKQGDRGPKVTLYFIFNERYTARTEYRVLNGKWQWQKLYIHIVRLQNYLLQIFISALFT